MKQAEQFANELKKAKTVTFLTGAGVSTASGIPDFRSTTGLWAQDKSREYYMSRQYFLKNPEDFWGKYKEIFRLKLLKNYEPNRVHLFLKELEENGKNVTVITQNVDGLHSRAGNRHVIEYHGNLNTATCPNCGATYSLSYIMTDPIPMCSESGCGDILKPDIVLFGDPITVHDEAEQTIDKSELLLVLGTSLMVTPFNMLPSYAASNNITMAIINREPTPMDAIFDYIFHDDLVQAINDMKAY